MAKIELEPMDTVGVTPAYRKQLRRLKLISDLLKEHGSIEEVEKKFDAKVELDNHGNIVDVRFEDEAVETYLYTKYGGDPK